MVPMNKMLKTFEYESKLESEVLSYSDSVPDGAIDVIDN